MAIMTEAGEHRSPFANKFQIMGSFFHRQGKMQVQSANKACWRDVKIYRSKDVPWRVTCRRMVGQVYSVFCFGSENYCWSQAVMDRIEGWENENSKKAFFTG